MTREILLVIFKIVDSRQSGPNFWKFILFSFAYLDAEKFAKKPMPTCRLCLYSMLFHTTCSSLSSSIRRTLFYPIPIPNKYIVVQWFSSLMMMMQKLHISKQQNALYLHIYTYTSLEGGYLKND